MGLFYHKLIFCCFLLVCIAAMGYLGAIGAKHLRTVGSLTGMGLGGLVGSYVPEKLFSQFDSKTV